MATQQWNWSFTPTRATPAKDLPSNTDWKRVILTNFVTRSTSSGFPAFLPAQPSVLRSLEVVVKRASAREKRRLVTSLHSGRGANLLHEAYFEGNAKKLK